MGRMCETDTYGIRDVAQTYALEVPRQTPIVPERAGALPLARPGPGILLRLSLVPPELSERSLHAREHLLRDHGTRRARDAVEDVRELEGGQDESAALGLALARLARDELFERDRLARDPLSQFRHFRHELQALGLVRFAA